MKWVVCRENWECFSCVIEMGSFLGYFFILIYLTMTVRPTVIWLCIFGCV